MKKHGKPTNPRFKMRVVESQSYRQGSWHYQRKRCTSLKITIYLHCLILPKHVLQLNDPCTNKLDLGRCVVHPCMALNSQGCHDPIPGLWGPRGPAVATMESTCIHCGVNRPGCLLPRFRKLWEETPYCMYVPVKLACRVPQVVFTWSSALLFLCLVSLSWNPPARSPSITDETIGGCYKSLVDPQQLPLWSCWPHHYWMWIKQHQLRFWATSIAVLLGGSHLVSG